MARVEVHTLNLLGNSSFQCRACEMITVMQVTRGIQAIPVVHYAMPGRSVLMNPAGLVHHDCNRPPIYVCKACGWIREGAHVRGIYRNHGAKTRNRWHATPIVYCENDRCTSGEPLVRKLSPS